MQTSTVTQKTITLTREEEHWLKAIMQNPIFVDHPDKEEEIDKVNRCKFFDSLDWINDVKAG